VIGGEGKGNGDGRKERGKKGWMKEGRTDGEGGEKRRGKGVKVGKIGRRGGESVGCGDRVRGEIR
jgi:hypothetical protein